MNTSKHSMQQITEDLQKRGVKLRVHPSTNGITCTAIHHTDEILATTEHANMFTAMQATAEKSQNALSLRLARVRA